MDELNDEIMDELIEANNYFTNPKKDGGAGAKFAAMRAGAIEMKRKEKEQNASG